MLPVRVDASQRYSYNGEAHSDDLCRRTKAAVARLLAPLATPAAAGAKDASTAIGAQDGVRYASFAAARRLALEHADRLSTYDALERGIAGVAQ